MSILNKEGPAQSGIGLPKPKAKTIVQKMSTRRALQILVDYMDGPGPENALLRRRREENKKRMDKYLKALRKVLETEVSE